MSPSSRTRLVSFRAPNDLAQWLEHEAARQGHGNVSRLIVDTLADLKAQTEEHKQAKPKRKGKAA